MALHYQQDEAKRTVLDAAYQIANAARTAPKARGIDHLIIAVADAEELRPIAKTMLRMHEEGNAPEFFARDAQNLMASQAMVVIGTKIKTLGLDCGLCGMDTCAQKNKYTAIPCVFNTNDLGIAIGSAASRAADLRLDNRVMYSAGVAAKEMKLLGEEAAVIFCLPLAVASKSPFFDRKAAVK